MQNVYLFSPILRLDKELIYIQLNITENYDVISLNINDMFNVYPIPLYIVGCLSLIIMTFIVILSEKYNIPLWLEKETNIQNSILNKSKLINEEMGTIYFIYQINKFQRCCNLYTLNIKNNWFFTQIFCRLYGTNYTTSERLILFYFYLITIIACNTYFYSTHNYKYFDLLKINNNNNFYIYYPFILISIIPIIPIILFKCIFKKIHPINFNKISLNHPSNKIITYNGNYAYANINRQPTRESTMHAQQEAIYNSNTQIILDWDDTLFSTAFTEYNIQNGYFLNNNNIINNKLKLIEIESNN